MALGTINSIALAAIGFLIKRLSKKRLLILNYHRVLASDECFFPGDLDEQGFEWHMSLVERYFIPMTVSEGARRLYDGSLPEAAIAITFDDGYLDNVTKALPILKAKKIPATFYIATSFLNQGMMWNDVIVEAIRNSERQEIDLSEIGLGRHPIGTHSEKLQAINTVLPNVKYKTLVQRQELIKDILVACDVSIQQHLMMKDRGVKTLFESGMEIGGHTVEHPILNCEQDDSVKEEVQLGKHYLETLLKIRLSSFAYPNGRIEQDYSERHLSIIADCGFDYSVTTNHGLNNSSTHPMTLYRVSPWDKTPLKLMLRLLLLYLRSER